MTIARLEKVPSRFILFWRKCALSAAAEDDADGDDHENSPTAFRE